MREFAPFSGAVGSPIALAAGIADFVDGLDIEGSDYYFSPEGGAGFGNSFKNGAILLDDVSGAQTDLSGTVGLTIGTTILRWAGIEAVTSLGAIYTVADTSGDRTIATYDFSGGLLAVDPDGSPFASRIEDLAFDGRYLYGASLGDSRIFVFDIDGLGGTTPVVPEPTTLVIWSILGGIGLVVGRRRSKRKAA